MNVQQPAPLTMLEGVRCVIREVKRLVCEALNALKSYDFDNAEKCVARAAEELDRAFVMLEKLEGIVRGGK